MASRAILSFAIICITAVNGQTDEATVIAECKKEVDDMTNITGNKDNCYKACEGIKRNFVSLIVYYKLCETIFKLIQNCTERCTL